MNVQITSLSETEPKEKENRKQNIRGGKKTPHRTAQSEQHKCHGNQFTAKLNKVPASINFYIFCLCTVRIIPRL